MGYFLDTYSLVEIVKGNKKFEKYLDEQLATTLINLYELSVLIMKDFGKEKAIEIYSIFLDIVIPVEDRAVFLASEISLEKKISHIDALGYAVSQINGLKFLTTNTKMKDMKNVEFVK